MNIEIKTEGITQWAKLFIEMMTVKRATIVSVAYTAVFGAMLLAFSRYKMSMMTPSQFWLVVVISASITLPCIAAIGMSLCCVSDPGDFKNPQGVFGLVMASMSASAGIQYGVHGFLLFDHHPSITAYIAIVCLFHLGMLLTGPVAGFARRGALALRVKYVSRYFCPEI